MSETVFFDCFSGWDLLTAKQKKFLRQNDIFCNLLLFLSSMFEYKGMSEDLNTDFIEFYNILSPYASCGVFWNEAGKEVLGYTSEGGMKDDYGICSKFNINTLGPDNKQGLIDGVNTAICWNNKIHRSDLTKLNRYTEMYNLVETAQKCLIKYARLFPVYQVEDANIENQVRNALKNADNGEPFTFTSKSLSKLGVDGRPGVDVIHLGDFSAVDKIQYLSTYHNDLLRRFFSMYGMSYSQSMKQAQQSIEEIHSDNKVSWIIPNDRLNERRKFIDKYNKVFHHNASVDFSDAWKDAYNEYMGSEVNDNAEEME